MSPREILYYAFYSICFVLAIWAGFKLGFTGTHTPPGPFIVEVFTVPIGIVLFLADVRFYNSTKVHKIGLTANILILIYVLIRAFI